MPVLQWGMLCVLSLLLSIGFLAVHLPAALLLGPMIAGIIFSMRGITLQLPRSAFLAAQAILGCMIAQNLTGSILTTLAVNWPIVLAILLVTLLSSAIVGWLLVRYSSLPGNTGAWGSSPGGAAAMVAMAQDYGADIRLVAFMQYLRVLFVAGAAVLVTRMMLGDNAEAVNQHIVWFPPVSINLLLTIFARGRCRYSGMPAASSFRHDAHPDAGGRSAPVWSAHHHRTTGMAAGDGVYGNWLADWSWFR